MSLGKHLAISRPSALLHKIRSAMQQAHFKTWLSGLVCVDEGYVGGALSSPHESARSTIKKSPISAMVEERGPNQTGLFTSNQRHPTQEDSMGRSDHVQPDLPPLNRTVD